MRDQVSVRFSSCLFKEVLIQDSRLRPAPGRAGALCRITHLRQGSFIVNASEGFFPAGWLALSSEQSAQIKAVLGKDVSAVPVYNVVARDANNGYQPLNVVPGLACLVVHEGAQRYGDAQAGVHADALRALPDDLARAAQDGVVAAADPRATARQGDDEAAKNARLKQK
jgi:hypothetical protein